MGNCFSAGKHLDTVGGHTGAVLNVVFSRDGQYVLTSSEDKTCKLWKSPTSTGEKEEHALCTLSGHTSHVYSAAFSNDNIIIATGSRDGHVKLWKAVNKFDKREGSLFLWRETQVR